MTKRHCTLPNIPWFRDWFVDKFNDLCDQHDKDYKKMKTIKDKHIADFRMAKLMAIRGYPLLAIGALLIFQLPWVGRHVR